MHFWDSLARFSSLEADKPIRGKFIVWRDGGREIYIHTYIHIYIYIYNPRIGGTSQLETPGANF